MTDPDSPGEASDHDEGHAYRRPNDHLVEPFFAGLPERRERNEDSDPVVEAGQAAPDADRRRGTLHVVRAWIQIIVIRIRR